MYNEFSLLTYLAYAMMIFTVIALWAFRHSAIWAGALAASLLLGYFDGRASLLLLVAIGLLSVMLWVAKRTDWVGWAAWLLALMLGLALGVHVLPVDNAQVFAGQLKADSIDYKLYFNFDKAAAGVLIAGIMLRRISHVRDWRLMLYQAARPAVIAMLIVASLALTFDYVDWSPQFHWLLPVWLLHNLLFTCLTEEAFFRGLIQGRLAILFSPYRWGGNLAIAIGALLFGAAHFAGGLTYVVLASIAGAFYGYCYHKTKRIEAAMLCHVVVNLFHFILLSYPALA